jgi:hypothetical protein
MVPRIGLDCNPPILIPKTLQFQDEGLGIDGALPKKRGLPAPFSTTRR